MTDPSHETSQTYDRDDWLTSVFAAAAGPFVDTAFADRTLTRLQQARSPHTHNPKSISFPNPTDT